MIVYTTHNMEKKKYMNYKRETIEQYSGKESTDAGTKEEKIPL